MKLYLLKRRDVAWYDETVSVVVSAEDSREAREYAASVAGDEGANTWRNPKRTTCVQLKAERVVGVVVRDFRAG